MPLPATIESETFNATRALFEYLSAGAVGESKADYLALRFTGFRVREAVQICDIHEWTVRRWRDADSVFAELDRTASQPMHHDLRKEILSLLFVRNYHLVLRKDFEVLMKALGHEKDEEGNVIWPNPREFDYLTKARAHYTPQQLLAIDNLLLGQSGEPIDFAKFILSMTKRVEEVKIELKSGDTG